MGPPLSHAKAEWALDPGPCFVWEGNLTPVVLSLWEVCVGSEGSEGQEQRARSREHGSSTSIVGQLYHHPMRLLSYQPAPPARVWLWLWIYHEAGSFARVPNPNADRARPSSCGCAKTEGEQTPLLPPHTLLSDGLAGPTRCG